MMLKRSCLAYKKGIRWLFLVGCGWILLCSFPLQVFSQGKGTRAAIDSLIVVKNHYESTWPDSLFSISNEILQRSKTLNYLPGRFESLDGLVAYYIYTNNVTEAMDLLYQKLTLHLVTNYYPGYIFAHSRLSSLFLRLNDTVNSMNHILSCMELARKSREPADFGYFCSALARYEFDRKRFNRSIRYSETAAGYFYQAGLQNSMLLSWLNIGDAYLQTGFYKRSVDYYHSALRTAAKTGNLTAAGILYTRIAHIYELTGDLRKVISYNMEALRVRQNAGRMDLLAQSMVNIGGDYLKLKRFDSAGKYLLEGLPLLERSGNISLLPSGYLRLSDYYNARKDYRKAFEALRKSSEYKKRQLLESSLSKIRLLNAKWEVTEKEHRNEMLRQNNVLQKKLIRAQVTGTILTEAGFLIVLFFVLVVYRKISNTRKTQKSILTLNKNLKSEIADRQEAELKLMQSEERYRFIAENIVDMISLLNSNLKRLQVSPSCRKLFGYEPGELTGKITLFDIIDPSYRIFVNQRLVEMLITKKSVRYDFLALRKDGSTFWAESNINPVVDPETGEIREVISVIRDISELKEYEEFLVRTARQKEILLREIHHRVKNNFSILSSLINIQLSGTPDPLLRHSLTDLHLRIRTMSLVHEQLYSGTVIDIIQLSDYLEILASIIASAYHNPKISLTTDLEPCVISIETALPLGLIVNELITNTFKYAFPDGREGSLQIFSKREAEGRWMIGVCDNGIGLPEGFSLQSSHSMGMKIISILVEQLEARIEFDSDQGTCFRIILSL